MCSSDLASRLFEYLTQHQKSKSFFSKFFSHGENTVERRNMSWRLKQLSMLGIDFIDQILDSCDLTLTDSVVDNAGGSVYLWIQPKI